MPQPPARPQAPPLIVFWVIWFAILSGLLMMQFFAGGGLPSGEDQGDGGMVYQMIGGGMAVAAVMVRFGVIPRIKGLQKKLPTMIVGLALSEGIGIVGMFVVPAEFGNTRLFMLVLSVICIVLQAPLYARQGGGGNPFVGGA